MRIGRFIGPMIGGTLGATYGLRLPFLVYGVMGAIGDRNGSGGSGHDAGRKAQQQSQSGASCFSVRGRASQNQTACPRRDRAIIRADDPQRSDRDYSPVCSGCRWTECRRHRVVAGYWGICGNDAFLSCGMDHGPLGTEVRYCAQFPDPGSGDGMRTTFINIYDAVTVRDGRLVLETD